MVPEFLVYDHTEPLLKFLKTKTTVGGCKGYHLNLKLNIMGNLLYIIAVILVVIWAISFLGGYYTGGIIHILLVIAIIAILLKVINRAA